MFVLQISKKNPENLRETETNYLLGNNRERTRTPILNNSKEIKTTKRIFRKTIVPIIKKERR